MDDCHLNNITKLKAIVSPFFDLKKTLVPLRKFKVLFKIKELNNIELKIGNHLDITNFAFDDLMMEILKFILQRFIVFAHKCYAFTTHMKHV
jgi:hypothetical protein